MFKFYLSVVGILLPRLMFAQTQESPRDSASLWTRSLAKMSDRAQKVDSIESFLSGRIDSLVSEFNQATGRLNVSAGVYEKTLDSLRAQGEPLGEVTQKYDSVRTEISKAQDLLRTKSNAVKTLAKEKLAKLNLPPEMSSRVSAMTAKADQAVEAVIRDRTGNYRDLLAVAKSVGKVIPSVPSNLPGTSSIPVVSPLNDVTVNGALKTAGGKELSQVKELANTGKSLNGSSFDELADSKASHLKQLKGISSAQQNAVLPDVSDPNKTKIALKQEAQKAAVDYFANKDEQLKHAMSLVSKYKGKYHRVENIQDIKHLPKSQLAGKKFRERVVPGFNLQIQKRDENILVDINPFIGYRITERITAGPGWNQRISYQWNTKSFDHSSDIYGPRIFAEVKLPRGFFPRVETEWMNTYVPNTTQANVDLNERQWVFGVFAGVKKQYHLIGRVNGTAIVMVRLFDKAHTSPYTGAVNARIGFEFSMANEKKRTD
jgi:hypothetical protein